MPSVDKNIQTKQPQPQKQLENKEAQIIGWCQIQAGSSKEFWGKN